jgi:hypothetical protein
LHQNLKNAWHFANNKSHSSPQSSLFVVHRPPLTMGSADRKQQSSKEGGKAKRVRWMTRYDELKEFKVANGLTPTCQRAARSGNGCVNSVIGTVKANHKKQ